MNRARLIRRAVLASTLIAIATTTVTPGVAQSRKTTAAPRAAAAPRTAGGGGLSSLSDEAVLSDLAGRQMQGLLDYAFKSKKISETDQAAMLAIPAIQRLADKEHPPREFERVRLLNQI